ncbi:MAG: rod shape-determining protein RodA [Candidatus Marinimicrobia bacterium]|nr:rod shape-determining protein RodA [Candidatus Neomarinimicrobiota bacterium]
MNQFSEKIRGIPFSWLIIAFLMNGLGLFALYSTSTYSIELSLHSRFVKQILWLIPSLAIFFFLLFISKKKIHKYSYPIFGLTFLVLFIPYITGSVAGTYRWISIGGMNFQPSEIIKWVGVVALAKYLSDYNLQIQKIHSMLIPIAIMLIPTIVIVKQPDLGSAIIIMSPLIPMLYWVGAKPFHILLLIAPIISILTAFNYYTFTIWIVGLAIILYLVRPNMKVSLINFFSNIFIGLLTPFLWNQLQPYQKERVLVLLDLNRDPYGVGYQVIQSQTAIGSGGFWGKGWQGGTQTHLKFLPEQETDFIFSVIGEEFGFFVVSILIIFAIFFIIGMIKAASKSSERFPSLVLIGIATLFMAHFFVNISMTINLLPVKGLPLPFLSYGGTFLVSCYGMLGLAMNMSVETLE